MKNTLDSSIVKLTNYRSVWGYIHKNKQATIPQIAKSIGLSLPTVTRAIDYGVAEGIINPDGVIGAERGRKAQVYKLNADYMHFLLIYLDSDVLSYRIHDFKSRTIGSGNIPICDEKVLSTLENLVMTSVAADPLIAMTAIAVSGAAGEVENIPLHTSDIESERIAFCSERLQAIIALMNPGRVVIYELDEGMDTDKLIGLIKSKMKPYLLPEFKLGRDFFEDCFLGLSIVCEVGIKQSLQERLDF